MEFSKKVLIANWATTLILTGLVVVLSIMQIDCSEVSAMATLSWAALAVDQGFYSWKSKNENRIKLIKSMVKSWADEYGIEAVTALAEIVLKE